MAGMMYQHNVVRVQAYGSIIDIGFRQVFYVVTNAIISTDNRPAAMATDNLTMLINPFSPQHPHESFPLF